MAEIPPSTDSSEHFEARVRRLTLSQDVIKKSRIGYENMLQEIFPSQLSIAMICVEIENTCARLLQTGSAEGIIVASLTIPTTNNAIRGYVQNILIGAVIHALIDRYPSEYPKTALVDAALEKNIEYVLNRIISSNTTPPSSSALHQN